MAAVVVVEAATLRPELAPRLAQAAIDAAPLAGAANDAVLTPVQMATVERLALVGISRGDAKVLVQMTQQAPRTGPTTPPPPATPSTPATVSSDTKNKPGPQKEYSDF
jgi:hypothetical protein